MITCKLLTDSFVLILTVDQSLCRLLLTV